MIRFRVELILNYLKENNMSKAEFCKRVGISRSTLDRLLKSWTPFIPADKKDK